MANKTPYEIRADLLVLAQTICNNKLSKEGTDKAPSVEEIIDTARKLNTFVSDSPDRRDFR